MQQTKPSYYGSNVYFLLSHFNMYLTRKDSKTENVQKLLYKLFCFCGILEWATNIFWFQHGVAIRSGHHCAQPLHRHLGISASARASLHFYNTKEDVDSFIQALNDTVSFFNSFK